MLKPMYWYEFLVIQEVPEEQFLKCLHLQKVAVFQQSIILNISNVFITTTLLEGMECVFGLSH
jgi:hypothetical protein